MSDEPKLRAPERIETERLVLRPPTVADADAMFANYASDPEVTTYLTWRPHPSVDETERVLALLANQWTEGDTFPWAITIDDEIVGMIEVAIELPRAEFGWVLSRSLWGQGFMSEAANAVVDRSVLRFGALATETRRRTWVWDVAISSCRLRSR